MKSTSHLAVGGGGEGRGAIRRLFRSGRGGGGRGPSHERDKGQEVAPGELLEVNDLLADDLLDVCLDGQSLA